MQPDELDRLVLQAGFLLPESRQFWWINGFGSVAGTQNIEKLKLDIGWTDTDSVCSRSLSLH